MLAKLRTKFIHTKVYLHRALGYASVINMALILFLALSNLEKYGIDIKLEQWGVPLFLGFFVLIILFGYAEDKLGFFREEQMVHSERNPQMKEILKRLERIENKLK